MAEMLIGRYASDGADKSATTKLLETFQSGWVLSAVAAGVLLWFVGVGVFVAPLVMAGGRLRWPAVTFVIGALLILIEIATSQVLFSQIGNVVTLVARG